VGLWAAPARRSCASRDRAQLVCSLPHPAYEHVLGLPTLHPPIGHDLNHAMQSFSSDFFRHGAYCARTGDRNALTTFDLEEAVVSRFFFTIAARHHPIQTGAAHAEMQGRTGDASAWTAKVHTALLALQSLPSPFGSIVTAQHRLALRARRERDP
jgi:hypothetical protein